MHVFGHAYSVKQQSLPLMMCGILSLQVAVTEDAVVLTAAVVGAVEEVGGALSGYWRLSC